MRVDVERETAFECGKNSDQHGTVAFATGVIGGALKTPFLAPEFIFGVATSAVCFLLAILIER